MDALALIRICLASATNASAELPIFDATMPAFSVPTYPTFVILEALWQPCRLSAHIAYSTWHSVELTTYISEYLNTNTKAIQLGGSMIHSAAVVE
jgi:hypothetical protein